MPIDPRIALMGNPDRTDAFGAFNTSRAAAQTAQANQMAAQRRADALAAAQNYMRPPPVQPAPAMQPGSAGPAIAGAPLPSVNSMGAGMPMPVAAPAAPANAMRDITPLLQFAGDNGPIDALIAQHTRETTARATAAAQAIDDERLGAADTRARVQFTVEQAMPLWGLASVNPTDEELIAARDRTLAIPGIDAALVNQTYAPVLAMPFEGRVRYMADMSNSYTQSRAAEELRGAASEDFNAGDRITFRPMGGRARLPGEVPPDIAVALTPGQVQTQENREEDRAAPDFRERNDGATRWLEDINPDSPTFGQRRSARTIQPSPSGTRRGRDGPPPRPAQTAPRRRVYNPATGRVE